MEYCGDLLTFEVAFWRMVVFGSASINMHLTEAII